MKAVIYARVSTQDKQENARQIRELQAYAEYKKMNVVEIFQEKISGRIRGADRTEYPKMVKFIDDHNVKTVLVWELSRLGRKMIDSLTSINELSQKKVNIYIKKENINTLDDSGQLNVMTTIIISVLSGFAQMERDSFINNSRSGIRDNVALGGSGTGIIKAYGFKKVEKKLVVDSEESEVVKTIFKKYLSGLGTTQIANYLNEQGIPTRFNKLFSNKIVKTRFGYQKKGSAYKWADGTIYSILQNSIYCGKRKHKGEVFDVPAIISEETFNTVQEKLRSGSNKADNARKYNNYLKELIVCGCCGKNYYMHKRADGRDNAYKCISKRYGEDCGNPSVNIDKLLKSLYITCVPILFASRIKTDAQTSIRSEIEKIDLDIKAVEKEIKTLERKIENLIDLNISGELTVNQFKKVKADIERDIDKKQEHYNKLLKEKNKLNNTNFDWRAPISQDIFNREIRKAVSSIVVSVPPAKLKIPQANKIDIPVMITVNPLFPKMPLTRYVLTRFTDNLHYCGDENKVKEVISLDF